MKFYYVYKSLAHPGQNGYVDPLTLEERLLHVAEASRQLDTQFEWLCDSMTNDLKHALGNAPNSEFVIGPDGKILRARRWSDPRALRRDLAELVGEVSPATTVADLGRVRPPRPTQAPTGVVPRLAGIRGMTPVRVRPIVPRTSPTEPLYVKLRAEVDFRFFRQGSGRLYLGFFVDPLHKVHWNNEVPPIAYEVEHAAGVEVAPATGKGPAVEEPADADPREFLLDVTGDSNAKLTVTVKYFACDDAETFCKAVTQQFEVSLTRDRDAGRTLRRRGGSERPGRGWDGPDRPYRDPAPRDADARAVRRNRLRRAIELIRDNDTDGDSALDTQEWPRGEGSFAIADSNDDDRVDLRELLKALD